MAMIDAPAAALAWIGRQGTGAVAASIFVGLAIPPLAALAKPILTETLFVMLCLAFLRVDPAAMRIHVSRPGLALGAAVWTMVAVPMAAGIILPLTSLDTGAPALFIALMLQAAAPPIISSPAFAALIGLDAALSLIVLIACTAVTPLTASIFAAIFIGPTLAISPSALGLRLFTLLAGAALVAAIVRRIAGQAWLDDQRDRIDGLNVIALFVFAMALMDGVLAHMIAEPLKVMGLLALAFAISLGLGATTALLFGRAGRGVALALAASASARNMGLMLAAAGGFVPDLTWLYFALAQFPIYLLPHLLKPLARAVSRSPHVTD